MKSIRRYLATRMGGAALAILLVGGFGLYFSVREALQAQFEDTLVTKAQALVTASQIDGGELEIDLDVQAFAGFGSNAPGDYFQVFTEDGETVMRSPSLGSMDLPPPADFTRSEEGFAHLTLPESVPGRAYWTTYTPPFDDEELENAAGPKLRILVASANSTLRRTFRTVALFIALFGFGGVFAILAILNAGVRAGLKPLDRLSADVQRIDVRQLARRVRVEGLPDELFGVSAKLNELLERLEASFTREKRFTSDVAHELRTPLAELRAMADVATQWPEDFTADHGREMLEVMAELETLLDTLSLLARAESDAAAARETVALAESVREQIDRHEEAVRERRLQLDVELEEGEIRTDPALWRSIVQNLLGNAVSYAPAGGAIHLAVSPHALSVENDAPDLEESDLPHLFERFWRKSDSRSGKGHSGLGLSLVRAAVEFLGGTCRATLEDGRLRVEVRWESGAAPE